MNKLQKALEEMKQEAKKKRKKTFKIKREKRLQYYSGWSPKVRKGKKQIKEQKEEVTLKDFIKQKPEEVEEIEGLAFEQVKRKGKG